MKSLFVFPLFLLFITSSSNVFAQNSQDLLASSPESFTEVTKVIAADTELKKLAAKIDEYMQAAVKNDQFSGSILVAQKGAPIISKGYRLANYELKVPNTPQTTFTLASITKQFTGVAIMKLQEQRWLKVSDKICKYLDNCPVAWQAITIHQLLTHTSGIENFSSLPDWDEEIAVQPTSREGFVDVFRDLPLEFSPGEKFEYSNSGYYLLGLIVEGATGQSYEDYLQRYIFTPLGMKNTGLVNPRSLQPNRASGYDWSGNYFVHPDYEDLTHAFSNGGIYSTTEDLLLWDKALYGEQVVSKQSLEKIFTPFKEGYGYGWNINEKFGRKHVGHSGSLMGFSTYLSRFPAEQISIIILSNSDRTSATKVANNLAAIVFDQDYELPQPQLYDLLYTTLQEEGEEAAVQQYRDLKKAQKSSYDFGEDMLNELGYDLLYNKERKGAIAIFELAVEMFPQSANTYDSLAEGYFENKNYLRSIKNYQKSLDLDPDNKNAERMLEKIKRIGRDGNATPKK